MARALRPVGIDFAETAQLRLTFATHTAAAPEPVYRALAEEVAAWPRWFRAVTLARPVETSGRRGRVIGLMGGTRFIETIMAAESARRYAYRVDATNALGVRAMLEDWRLFPAGSGTVVRWTVAVDAPPPVRWVLRLARPALRHAFRDAVHALDRRLAAAPPSGSRITRTTGRPSGRS